MTKAAFDTELQYESDQKKIMASLNNAVYKFSSSEKFVTFLIASFDFNDRSVVTSNAGHLPLLYYNAANHTISELKPNGILLGAVQNSEYASKREVFSQGDIFVGITDGIVESRNKKNEEFGVDRLKNAILTNKSKSAKEIFQALISAQNSFSKMGTEDDISVFVLKIV